jgi:hypothetical protein
MLDYRISDVVELRFVYSDDFLIVGDVEVRIDEIELVLLSSAGEEGVIQ